MGQGIISYFLALLGACWNMSNNPSVEDHELLHDVGQMSKAIDSGELCDLYLKHTKACSNRARKMISGSIKYDKVKLNPNQCEYLVESLEIAERDIGKSLIHSSREHEVECLEVLKFLHRLAKEVESFTKTCCCNDKMWLQVALTSASVVVHVSSIGYNLKLCTMLLCDWNKLGVRWLTFSKMKLNCALEDNLRIVQEKALLDEGTLWKLLKCHPTMLTSSMTTEMASILLKRLKSKQRQSSGFGEDFIEFWKIDLESLTEAVHIYDMVSSVVNKANWIGEVEIAEKGYPYVQMESRSYAVVEPLTLAKLSHPNIVSLLGITLREGDISIIRSTVLELMDGDMRTLMQQRMQEDTTLKSPFSIYEACDLMLQVAEGVNYMHENGVIHRNLRSEKILVRSSKEEDKNKFVCAKLGSMTISKVYTRDISSHPTGLSKMNVRSITLSHPTWNIGSTRWMAPEVYAVSGRAELITKIWYPFKIDVYSFSMVCYEILTGDLPFHDHALGSVRRMVLAGERPSLPSHCPRDLQDLIKLCWDREPNTRPSFAKICEELRYIKCSLFLEPIDQRLQATLPISKPLDLPLGVLPFKTDYSSLKVERQLTNGGSDIVTLYVTSWQKESGEKREVAQKTFLGACNKSFVNEVSILAGLKDDHIIRLLSYATDRRSCSIVMDLMDGDLLYFINIRKSRLKSNSTCTSLFSMPEALHIMVQIAQGIQYIHGRRIVHRDLKSKNILVKTRGKTRGDVKGWDVKVADFGLSQEMDNRAVLSKAFAVGTIRWTALEIVQEVLNHGDIAFEGPSNCDYDPFKCDIYSFGMVCYELLTGNMPFHDIGDLEEVKEQILGGTHLPLSLPEGTSPNMRELIEKCWLKEASKRPSFVEIVEVLKADQCF